MNYHDYQEFEWRKGSEICGYTTKSYVVIFDKK